jgi:hypothetical protein
MSVPHEPKVAGISSLVPAPAPTPPPLDGLQAPPVVLIQDRLAGWVSDLTTLHELTERLARTDHLERALAELLDAGGALVGARRGFVVLDPADGLGPRTTVGLGLSGSDLGHLETVPRSATAHGAILDLLDGRDAADAQAAGTPAHAGHAGTAGTPAHAGTAENTRNTGHAHDVRATEEGREGAAGRDGGNGEEHAAVGPAGGADAGGGTGGVRGAGRPEAVACPDLLADPALDARHREVAGRLGYGATYTVPLVTDPESNPAGEPAGRRPRRLGAVTWLYDGPAEPDERSRHLVGLYSRYAGEHLARLVELERARSRVDTVADELLPARLPRMSGVRLAVCHRTGPRGGGHWYDALPLPQNALGLAVGSVSGSGPAALAAVGRLRASLRAYAVMEGEDPVAVLSDLELLLRLTEPARTATALFAYAEPAAGRIVLAGAGHAPPLIVGDRRCEYVETTLSAPLGMLACWEAPSVELSPEPGETVLLYTDGLLRRTGDPMDRAYARLHAAAASVPASVRSDPSAVAEHVVRTVLADAGTGRTGTPERGSGVRRTGAAASGADEDADVVLLAVRFDG